MTTEQILLLMGAGVTAFFLAALLGKVMIPELHKLHFGQTIREEGPAWHQKKQGTPTMGGLIFIFSATVVTTLALLLSQAFLSEKVLSGSTNALVKLFGALFLALGCGLIGFTDDYIKVVKKRNLGLTAMQKLGAQILVACGYALSTYFAGAGMLYVPFCGYVDFGIWYIPFCVFVILAMSNATNLTDGLDGLASSVCATVAAFTLLLAVWRRDADSTVLAAALRELERDGLVRRQAYPEVPVRVEYSPTERCLRLLPVLIVSAVIYGLGMLLTFRKAAKLYEKVDL